MQTKKLGGRISLLHLISIVCSFSSLPKQNQKQINFANKKIERQTTFFMHSLKKTQYFDNHLDNCNYDLYMALEGKDVRNFTLFSR